MPRDHQGTRQIKNYSDPSRQNLANTYFELAFCSEELNRHMKATLSYNQDGLKLYEDIDNKPKLDDFPLDRRVVRAGFAEAYTRVGVTQYRMGELTAALENYRKAYNLRRKLADDCDLSADNRRSVSPSSRTTRERLGRESEIRHQKLEVGPVSERVDGGLGAVGGNVAPSRVRRALKQRHRLGDLRLGLLIASNCRRSIAIPQHRGQRLCRHEARHSRRFLPEPRRVGGGGVEDRRRLE
jgi:tetratricopeptide (TPR) repeat protein